MSDIICIFAKSKHRIVRCGDRAFNALLLQETGHFDRKVMSENAHVYVVFYSFLFGKIIILLAWGSAYQTIGQSRPHQGMPLQMMS